MRGWKSIVAINVALLGFWDLTLGRCAWAVAPSANAAKEQANQRIAVYEEAKKQIRGWYYGDIIDARYRKQMTHEVGPNLKKTTEFEAAMAAKSGGPTKSGWLFAQCEGLAVLSLFGDADATQQLDDMKSSKDPITAINGTVGTWLWDWWKHPSEEPQKKLLDEMQETAKADPKEDSIARALLTAAEYGAASDAVAETARQIVDRDLKGLQAAQYRARPNKLGRPLVITGRTYNGKQFSTASWKGKVILVDIWATWCPPCRESLPEMSKFYTDYHDQGLEIVGLDCDSDLPTLKSFLADHQQDMPWPQLFAPTPPYGFHTIAKSYGVEGIPTMYLIDRNGILRTMQARRLAKEMIPKLLAEQATPAPASPAKTAKGG